MHRIPIAQNDMLGQKDRGIVQCANCNFAERDMQAGEQIGQQDWFFQRNLKGFD